MSKYSEEVKEKIKNFSEEPGRLFGLIYPFVLVLITIIGFYYIMHINDSARQHVNPAIPDSTIQSDLPVVQARTIPPVDINTIGQSTTELLNKGKNLFQSNCVSCHGEEGKGNGPASTGLNPPPRNFTNPSGWKNGSKLTQIFTTLHDGIPGSAMIAYELLSPEEKFSIAHYIRTAFIPNPPKDTQDDLMALDQLYNLSKGQNIPAQIPVSSAEKIVLTEKDSVMQNTIKVIGKISLYQNEEGKIIFSNIANNTFKAITYLNSSKDWMQSETNLMNYLTLNVNQNGFNSRVFNLKHDEITKLYSFISKVF